MIIIISGSFQLANAMSQDVSDIHRLVVADLTAMLRTWSMNTQRET
ncbi:hypothetical protein ACVBKF_07060 [Shewanella sp. 0m-11]